MRFIIFRTALVLYRELSLTPACWSGMFAIVS
jgi:hypothetical protein